MAAYLYDSRESVWTPIGDLSGDGIREFVECGVVKDSQGRPLKVVAAGSRNSPSTGYDVDIYNLLTGTWTTSGEKILSSL